MMDWRIIAILIQISSIYAFENHPRCGRSPTGSSQHTNGRQVTTINYPWVVAITQGDDIHCTGSIISSRFIISAAHCTRGVDTSKLEIVLGASNLKDPNNSEKGVIKRQIKSFESHNKNENGVDYDIAIIEVDEEILFVKENPRVWPICLPEKSDDNPNHLQFRGIKVLGYGPQDDEDLMLTAVDLNVKPLPICNEKYTVGQSNRNFWEILDSLPTKFDGGSVFCASNVATDDATCRGDSGGPATFFDGIKHRQLGVIHGSITSCDGSRFPSIFVRIDNPEVYDWITKVTSSDLVIDEAEIEKLKAAVFKAVRENNFSKAKEIQQKIDKILMDKTQASTNQNSLQGSLILVVPGRPSYGTTQVIDINSSSSSCSDLPSYPIDMFYSTGGVLGGFPINCGGRNNDVGLLSSCYRYDKYSNAWKLHANMSRKAHKAASALLNGALWVTGGYANGRSLASTELIHPNGTVTNGPSLPAGRDGHCMVNLPDGRILIIGAESPYSLTKNVLFFDPVDNTFTTGPSLLFDKAGVACALFHSPLHGKRPVVLVARQTAEVYDYTQTNATWIQISSLPTTHEELFYGAKALPSSSGNGVILQYLKYFYELTCTTTSCSWSIMPQELKQATRNNPIMYLPQGYTC